MSRLATRRLIDASAALEPADRALLNLWVNRGLSVAALARMTGMSEETIAWRRDRIVEHLSDQLGLPPGEIRDALGQIVQGDEPDLPAGEAGAGLVAVTEPSDDRSIANGVTPSLAADAPPSDNGIGPQAVTDSPPPASALTPEPGPELETQAAAPGSALAGQPPVADEESAGTPALDDPTSEPSRRRPGRVWGALSLLVIVVAGVVLVSALASGGGTPARHARPHPAPASSQTASTATASTPTVSTPTASQTVPAPGPSSPSPVAPPPSRLGALPGGLRRATGTVLITDNHHHLKLKLTVTHLPAPRAGHYEVWLYNSIIDSAPLGRLRIRAGAVSLALPNSARRYRWIDISIQPVGVIFHSGASVLRSLNPLFATRTVPKRGSARRRRLRRAGSSGSK